MCTDFEGEFTELFDARDRQLSDLLLCSREIFRFQARRSCQVQIALVIGKQNRSPGKIGTPGDDVGDFVAETGDIGAAQQA